MRRRLGCVIRIAFRNAKMSIYLGSIYICHVPIALSRSLSLGLNLLSSQDTDDIILLEMIVPTSRDREHRQSQDFAPYLMLISTTGPEKNFLAQTI